MILAAEAVPYKRLHVAVVELVKPGLEDAAAVSEVRRQGRRAGHLLEMQQGPREDVEVEGVGKVGGVDGRVDGGVGGREVHAAAGKGVFEDREHGEVVAGVEGWVRAVEEAGVVGVLGGRAAGEVDFLQARFLGAEELLQDEGVFLRVGGGSVAGRWVEKRLGDGS